MWHLRQGVQSLRHLQRIRLLPMINWLADTPTCLALWHSVAEA